MVKQKSFEEVFDKSKLPICRADRNMIIQAISSGELDEELKESERGLY